MNEWFSESVIQRQEDLDSNTETKQKQHSCSCHIAELSGAFFARISCNFQVSSMYIKT